MSLVDRAPWLLINDEFETLLDDLQALFERPAWMADALCREPAYADVNFFPARGEDARPAKAVCAQCLVRDECLTFVLEVEPTVRGWRSGVWGGTSAQQRQAIPARPTETHHLCIDCGDTFTSRRTDVALRCAACARRFAKREYMRRQRGVA